MSPSIKRLLAASLLSMVFCVPAFAADNSDVSDPLEPANRAIFWANDKLDQYVLEPIAEGYHYVMPQYGQDRVHHILVNLDEPLSTINFLLQGNFDESLNAFDRFLFNTTFGLAGMYDITGEQSTDKQTGFGDTFARWGVGSGPYLVLPLVGPSDLRASAGLIADYYGDPVSITVRADKHDIRDPETVLDIKYGVSVIDARSRLLKQIDDLRKNSLDFYAAARSIYMQRRAARLGDKGHAAADTSQPDYN